MKVLLTGHQGYLGTVMAPVLQAAGHEVTGLDVGWFERVRSTYRKSLDAFVEALEHSAPVPAPLSDGLRAQVIAEAATQSLRTGRPVAIPDGL